MEPRYALFRRTVFSCFELFWSTVGTVCAHFCSVADGPQRANHQGLKPGPAPLFSLVSDSSAFFPVVDVLGKDVGWGEENPVSGVIRVEAAAGAETL